MSVTDDLSISNLKCNTCRAQFSTIEKVKQHYKGEWHIINSKRRANELAPICKDEYKIIKPSLMEKQKANAKTLNESKDNKNSEHLNTESTTVIDTISSTNLDAVSRNDLGKERIVELLEVDPTISLFDQKKFETADDCVNYMAVQYGFFIPDREFLIDLPGMLTYLGEKIKRGGLCLHCQKQFKPGVSCQDHMISKSHCKIAYEEEIDLEEFEDFYDFSSTYKEDENEDENKIHVSHIGELVLNDGRTVGHRDFRRYYKQHYRPEETRPSVLALQREELLRLGDVFGPNTVKSEDIVEMTHAQLTFMIIKYHKDIRRSQMVEQRGLQRKELYDQKREYRSKIDKARGSATTTEKIRDYHKTIM